MVFELDELKKLSFKKEKKKINAAYLSAKKETVK